ncbi:MAG TPA: thioesterase family protein [Ilumatobacteraceae bacterium]|nr:thioesterase family protein [Ilumatobacteraceae bacterium]HRB04410.1 thioesterase family protein [Ilumatobacteraceae bacterium]
MTFVAVTGGGSRAAEWATRFLASGLDVVVDDSTLCEAVAALWPTSQRLGLFPGASLDRLRVVSSPAELASATFIQATTGVLPNGTGLIATEATARGCSPIHLVPLVEVDGPDSSALIDFYRSLGMAPVGADATAHDRWQLGEGLVRLTEGDPDSLLAVMRSLRGTNTGAGRALAHHEALRFAAGAQVWRAGDVVATPLSLYNTPVEPDWVDYNGHMTEAAYLTAAGWASDALFRYIGDDEAYRAAGHSFYTVETHIRYLLEVDVHEPIVFTTQLLGVDSKRVHLIHTMLHGDTGATLCTAEQMLVHVDMAAGRSVAILPRVAAALAAIAAAHAPLPIPSQVGSVMRLPAPRN